MPENRKFNSHREPINPEIAALPRTLTQLGEGCLHMQSLSNNMMLIPGLTLVDKFEQNRPDLVTEYARTFDLAKNKSICINGQFGILLLNSKSNKITALAGFDGFTFDEGYLFVTTPPQNIKKIKSSEAVEESDNNVSKFTLIRKILDLAEALGYDRVEAPFSTEIEAVQRNLITTEEGVSLYDVPFQYQYDGRTFTTDDSRPGRWIYTLK